MRSSCARAGEIVYVSTLGRIARLPIGSRLTFRATDRYRSSNPGESERTSAMLSKP